MVRSSEIGDCTMPKFFSKKETFFFQQFKSYALVSPSKNWYHLGIFFCIVMSSFVHFGKISHCEVKHSHSQN